MGDIREENSAGVKSDSEQNEKTGDAKSIFNPSTILVAVVVTFPAIMSTAIPESTHISIKMRLLLLVSASLPLAFEKILSTRRYFATQRAVLVWMCIAIVLIFADIEDKQNLKHGVYACYEYSKCWGTGPDWIAFAVSGYLGLLALAPTVCFFICQWSAKHPSQIALLMGLIASTLTLQLTLPTSLVSGSLLYALRPLQTILSTFLVSFCLATENVAAKWLDFVLAFLSLILAVLNAWSFAQFENPPLFVFGLSGSLCYILVFLIVMGGDQPTGQSNESVQAASDPNKT